MLVLSRKPNEIVELDVEGIKIRVVVCEIRGDRIRLGFDAPRSVQITRTELLQNQTTNID